MVGAESVAQIVDAVEQPVSCSTCIISVTLCPTPGRHADEGAVRSAIAVALDRPFPGVDAGRVAVDHQPAKARPFPGRAIELRVRPDGKPSPIGCQRCRRPAVPCSRRSRHGSRSPLSGTGPAAPAPMATGGQGGPARSVGRRATVG